MTTAGWVSIAWLWTDAADLIWSAYGVSSKIGRFVDRRAGIPLGRIALDEFEMLGEEQPEPPIHRNRFAAPPPGALPHRMTAEQHAALGAELRAVLQQLGQPWPLPKTNRRSLCRARLRHRLEQLRSMASGLATREHGDDQAHGWYYSGIKASRPLTCDVCRQPITDDRRAMVFGHVEAGAVVGFMLCHKGRRADPQSCDPRWRYSWELSAVLADSAAFWAGLTSFSVAPRWVRKKLESIVGVTLPNCTLAEAEGLHS